MGQKNPVHDRPTQAELGSYVLDMLTMLAQMAEDAGQAGLADRLRGVLEDPPPEAFVRPTRSRGLKPPA